MHPIFRSSTPIPTPPPPPASMATSQKRKCDVFDQDVERLGKYGRRVTRSASKLPPPPAPVPASCPSTPVRPQKEPVCPGAPMKPKSHPVLPPPPSSPSQPLPPPSPVLDHAPLVVHPAASTVLTATGLRSDEHEANLARARAALFAQKSLVGWNAIRHQPFVN
jgi:hypothetical protein